MRNFSCRNCGQVILFENDRCLNCGFALGYAPDAGRMKTLTQRDDHWTVTNSPHESYRYCANAQLKACNWLIPARSKERYCLACRHNRMVPPTSNFDALTGWRKIEIAKHRLFYSLLKFHLPAPATAEEDSEPLIFDFLLAPSDGEQVTTGHDRGVITIALDEADDGKRESARANMQEPYRTLLGHFRHEIGHYYWDKLIENSSAIHTFRSLFGDERDNYASALKRHYEQGPPQDWSLRYISAYASSHPWEDFAETFAHLLHIVDTLEAGRSEGLTLQRFDGTAAVVEFEPYEVRDASVLIDRWLDLSFSLNNINRAMGHADLYPFVISEAVAGKLAYVCELVHDHVSSRRPAMR
jgi:hypothetical protein